MLSAAEQEMQPLPQERLFNDPRYQKLKERWCAGTYGVGYSMHLVPCTVAVNEVAARRKVAKRYARSENMNLLLYVNFPARDIVYEQLATKLEFLSGTFLSAWIIGSEYICSIFSPAELGEVKGWGLMRRIHEPYK